MQIDVIEREKIRNTIEETENAIIVAQSVCFNTVLTSRNYTT